MKNIKNTDTLSEDKIGDVMKNPQIVFLVVIVGVSLIFGGYLLAPSSSTGNSANKAADTKSQTAVDTKLLNSESSPRIGSKDAKVQIVVFSDYQCPYCKNAHETVKNILDKYGSDVSVVQRNFIVHSASMILAQSAEAANLQGKYSEMNDALFSKNVEATEDAVVALAKELKLDENKFKSDLNSDKVKGQIEKDNSDAQTMNLGGTPSVFLNGEVVENFNNLESLVKEKLGK